MRSAVSPDPFLLEPSTAFYVPRRATVQALAQLQSAIEQDEPLVLLHGPAGIGKTLLLRLLRRRVESRMRCVELDAPGRHAEALCAAALAALGREAGEAPLAALALAAAGAGRGGLLLLVDRGEILGPEALSTLLDLAAHSRALQLVVAAESGSGGPVWLRSPDPRIALVALDEPMSAREMVEYLNARLDLAVAPREVRQRLDWRSWACLYLGSRGNPALLHHLVHQRLAGRDAIELPERLVKPTSRRMRLWLRLGSSLVLALALGLLLLDAPAGKWLGSMRPSLSGGSSPPLPETTVPLPGEPAPAAPGAEPTALEPAPADLVPAVEAPPGDAAPLESLAAEPAAPPRPAPPVEPRTPPVSARAQARPAPAPPPEASEPASEPPAAPASSRVPVFVNAVPAARIEIDGRDVGSTPIVALPVPAGTRRFAARFPDGRRIERTVEVRGEQVYVLFP